MKKKNTNSDALPHRHAPSCVWIQLSTGEISLRQINMLVKRKYIQGMRVRESNFYQANAVFSLVLISPQKCFMFVSPGLSMCYDPWGESEVPTARILT